MTEQGECEPGRARGGQGAAGTGQAPEALRVRVGAIRRARLSARWPSTSSLFPHSAPSIAWSAACAVAPPRRPPTGGSSWCRSMASRARCSREALASGRMPFLARLLERHDYRLSRWPSGCRRRRRLSTWRRCTGCAPTFRGFITTTANSVAISTSRGRDTPRRSRPSRRRGVAASSTAAAPTAASSAGSADNSLFSFTSLTSAQGRQRAQCAVGLRGGGFGSSVEPDPDNLWRRQRVGLRLIAVPFGEVGRWRWLTIKIGISVWVRQFFTLAAARDLYAGVPRIYVNYLDYDVSAHAFGPPLLPPPSPPSAGEKSPSGHARTGQAIGVLGIRASPFLRGASSPDADRETWDLERGGARAGPDPMSRGPALGRLAPPATGEISPARQLRTGRVYRRARSGGRESLGFVFTHLIPAMARKGRIQTRMRSRGRWRRSCYVLCPGRSTDEQEARHGHRNRDGEDH